MINVNELKKLKGVKKLSSKNFYKNYPNTVFMLEKDNRLNDLLRKNYKDGFVKSDNLKILNGENHSNIKYEIVEETDKITLKSIIEFVFEKNKEVWIDTYEMDNLIYNKNTKEIKLINNLLFGDSDIINFEGNKDVAQTILLLEKILQETQPKIAEIYFKNEELMKSVKYSYGIANILYNLWNFIIDYLKEFKVLLEEKPNYLVKNMHLYNLEINHGDTVEVILGLDNETMNRLDKLGLTNEIPKFQRLLSNKHYNYDDCHILIELLEMFSDKRLLGKGKELNKLIIDTLLLENLDTKKLINNIIQNYIYNNYENVLMMAPIWIASQIYDTLEIYEDYLQLCQRNNIEIVKYPDNIYKEYNNLLKKLA